MIKLLKFVSIFLIFSFSLLVSIPLFSQSNPIVQVDPVVNLSDEVWLDAVCDAATDNVLFTLKFLGQFEVISDTSGNSNSNQLESASAFEKENFNTFFLKKRAETEGYDNILFGSCTIEDGSYVITMNAYDLALDKITYSGSTVVESILDTFEAVDEITYHTVEGFSGIHVTYGSLVLLPPDTGELFSFTIDGIALSDGAFSVERMPVGTHELAVRQERPLGVYEAVHEIIVVEENENIFDILLPDITGEEIVVFNQADRYLTLTSLGKEPGLALAMNNLYRLLDTPFFKEYRSELVQKYEAWISMLNGGLQVDNQVEYSPVNFRIESIWDSESPVSMDITEFIQLPVLSDKVRSELNDDMNSRLMSNLVLDGNGDYGEIQYSSKLNLRSNITIEAWIYINSFSTNTDGSSTWGYTDSQPVISQCNDASTAGNYTFGITSEKLFFVFGNIDSRYSGPYKFEENRWYHIAVSHSFGDGSKTMLYVDGKEIKGEWVDDSNNKISGNELPSKNTKNSYFVGSYDPGRLSIFFNGSIAELRVWDIIRSNNDVNNFMTGDLDLKTEGLKLYYQFKEIQKGAVPEEANDNNLQLFGNATITPPPIKAKIRKEFTSLAIVSTLNYSGGQIHGITIAEGELWITDQRNRTLNQIDMNTGVILNTINLIGSHNLTGLTYRSENGHFYYTHDDSPRAIWETGFDGAVLGSFPAVGDDSTGLTIYRDYIYNADFSNGGQFHKMKIDDPEIHQTFASPSNGPEGLTWAYGSLWNIDIFNSTLYQINAADFSALNEYIIPNTENILGLAFDGTYFWVSDGNSLYKILLE